MEYGVLGSTMNRREFIGGTAGLVGSLLSTRCLAAPASKPAPASRSLASFEVTLRYDGEPIKPKVVDCSEDPYCIEKFREHPRTEDTLLVGPDQALQNVFVSIVAGLPADAKWLMPTVPVAIHENCWFTPHVLGVRVGQPLEFSNRSKTLEVPHGFAKRNKEFSFYIPEGMSKQVVLKYPETFRLLCDVHPWELAYCHVVSHPFFAVSDAQGKVAITGLPPGEYKVEFWHERLGTLTRPVKIEAGKTTKLDDVTFKPRSRHRRRRREPETRSSNEN